MVHGDGVSERGLNGRRGYGLARASLENFRQPDFGMENLPLGLTMGMMLSIPMMLVGAWLIWRAWSRPPVAA